MNKIDNIVTITAIALIGLALGFAFVSALYLGNDKLIGIGVYSFVGLIVALLIWKIIILFTIRDK